MILQIYVCLNFFLSIVIVYTISFEEMLNVVHAGTPTRCHLISALKRTDISITSVSKA